MIQINKGLNTVTIPYCGIEHEKEFLEPYNTLVIATNIFDGKQYLFDAVGYIDKCSQTFVFSLEPNMENGEYFTEIYMPNKLFKTLMNVTV